MLHEAGYNIISLFPASKGMNQNIGEDVLPEDYSVYIENILPISPGESQVRYGNNWVYQQLDEVIEVFPFEYLDNSGVIHNQQVVYFNGYSNFATVSNLTITAFNQITLTSINYALFKVGDYISLNYTDPNGTYQVYMEITAISIISTNTIRMTVNIAFPNNLANYFISQSTSAINYLANNSFSFVVPADFLNTHYAVGTSIILTVNAVQYPLTILTINLAPGLVTLTFNETTIPVFGGGDTKSFTYQSLTPRANSIQNSVGYIKIYDDVTNTFLGGGAQTLTNLSVSCLPRAEYFANVLWIYNGVDPIMTWDGNVLQIYTEPVKENAPVITRVDNTHLTFVPQGTFNILKYPVGGNVTINVIGGGNVTTTVVTITNIANVVTIQTTANLPAFTGANRVELFYFDKPPPFSYMKGALDRLWCLPPGAVGLNYRPPSLALSFYYSYGTYAGPNGPRFIFFNEVTKTVPSEDISAKHGGADNLEAIISISGRLAFMGRQYTQIWSGVDPLTRNNPNSFSWQNTVQVGVYHGNLIVELPNDVYFLNQNGFVSFGTINITRQYETKPNSQMDKIAKEYLTTITTDEQYRACRSFKYKFGGFCGFKIGFNNIIASLYNTSLYWWCILSGDFTNAVTFLSSIDNYLYLYINDTKFTPNPSVPGTFYMHNTFVYADQIFTYASGATLPIDYTDFNNPQNANYNGQQSVDFSEIKRVNKIKNRYANKRYEVQADYSSNILINPANNINIYIRGDLTDSFVLQDLYQYPFKGDVLGTITLASLDPMGNPLDPNNPSPEALGMRLDRATHLLKGRLKFVSSIFTVSLVGQIYNGPFSFKKIRLFGVSER